MFVIVMNNKSCSWRSFSIGGQGDGVFEQLSKKIIIFLREIGRNVLKKHAAIEIKKE